MDPIKTMSLPEKACDNKYLLKKRSIKRRIAKKLG